MSFRLSLPPTWTDVDLTALGQAAERVAYAAIRPESGDFTPSAAVTEAVYPREITLMMLLDRATGRSATSAASVQVVDSRQVGDGVLVRTVRAWQPDQPPTADPVLQYLVLLAGLETDGARTVVHLAVTISEGQAELIGAELEPMITSLSVVAGTPGRLP